MPSIVSCSEILRLVRLALNRGCALLQLAIFSLPCLSRHHVLPCRSPGLPCPANLIQTAREMQREPAASASAYRSSRARIRRIPDQPSGPAPALLAACIAATNSLCFAANLRQHKIRLAWPSLHAKRIQRTFIIASRAAHTSFTYQSHDIPHPPAPRAGTPAPASSRCTEKTREPSACALPPRPAHPRRNPASPYAFEKVRASIRFGTLSDQVRNRLAEEMEVRLVHQHDRLRSTLRTARRISRARPSFRWDCSDSQSR